MTASTLSLLAPLPPALPTLDGLWRIQPAHGDDTRYAGAACDEDDWPAVSLPHLRPATAEQDALWYRTRFRAAVPDGQRAILRLGGAFYHTRVWLNGVALGA